MFWLDEILRLYVTNRINLFKSSGNFTYHQVSHYKILRGAHIAFMFFVRISKKTATFAL
jgi:hypothetical protein